MNSLKVLCSALALIVLAAMPAAAQAEYLTPFGPPTRPFSPAVRVGDLIFLSGQIGTDANAQGALVPGGIEAGAQCVRRDIAGTRRARRNRMHRHQVIARSF